MAKTDKKEIRKQRIYIVTDARYNGNHFMEFFFAERDAVADAERRYRCMVEEERRASHLYILGAEVTLPKEYVLTTARRLMMGLIGGWIECPEYDAENCEFAAESVIFNLDYWKGARWG